jgi:hypothetical protein
MQNEIGHSTKNIDGNNKNNFLLNCGILHLPKIKHNNDTEKGSKL